MGQLWRARRSRLRGGPLTGGIAAQSAFELAIMSEGECADLIAGQAPANTKMRRGVAVSMLRWRQPRG